MSTFLRFALLCGVTIAAVTAARALPLTPVPGSAWPLDASLRPSLSPNLAPWQNWSGFHVGVNVGGAWDGAPAADFIGVPVSPFADFGAGAVVTQTLGANGAGAIGGAQIGYDFEWPFGLLTGVEADFQAFSFSDSAQLSTAALTGSSGAVKGTKRVDNLGTLRLRLGYQVTPGVLFYGTGGYAYGQAGFTASGAAVSFPLNFAAVSLANYAGQRGGFAAGGGLEYAISPNLIGRVEYLRYDLGGAWRLTPFLTTDGSLQWPGLAQRVAATFSGNILRVGLNYRFTPELPAPALPVVAKY
ncbi:MAG: outer membrane beta-barrel protein [Methylocystis sp.]